MSFYDYPELYATLLGPESDVLDNIYSWMDAHLEGSCQAVMDPACGPGTYLVPFAEDGCRVGGNDLRQSMVDYAREALSGHDAQLIQGDMRHLEFEGDLFDVAVNFYGSIGHLPDDAAVCDHLRAVAKNLRKGGLYFVGLTIVDGSEVDTTPLALFEQPAISIPSGGFAAIVYESLFRDPVQRRERIRLVALTKDVSYAPPMIQEEYDLLVFPEKKLREVVKASGCFEIVTAYGMDQDPREEVEIEESAGDVVLTLRRL